ncbi:F-box protein At2g27310-like [Impatiens glandulifera]|uniref:F-box protein At2g27310-like n=1 Tax=Impatiens glandulifera TaxID=253017 RepID=UPI001FB0A7C0|nr:F-box protein At2g27310-like [Impatiens glandulifera]
MNFDHSPATISSIHPDILQDNILTRLDGSDLASTGCASSNLYNLSCDESLWRKLCRQTWPSTADPRVQSLIAGFPSGHRSFYSDSFPTLRNRPNTHPPCPNTDPPQSLISAIDVFYKGELILSKVNETETGPELSWFLCSPFRVDLLDPFETYQIPSVKFSKQENKCLTELGSGLTVSWILIDPINKRAANLSTSTAVSVHRHWLTGEVQLRFATILTGGDGEPVMCGVVVSCGGKEAGEVYVKEVNLMLEDVDGRTLSGEDSLVILENAMERREKKRINSMEEKEEYREYQRMKKERREIKQKREKTVDMVCIFICVSLFVAGLYLWTMR